MARDNFEEFGSGYLRDRYGRREYVAVDKHQPPAQSDLPQADGYTDQDGREQIVLLSGDTGSNLLELERSFPVSVTAHDGDLQAAVDAAVSAGLRDVIVPARAAEYVISEPITAAGSFRLVGEPGTIIRLRDLAAAEIVNMIHLTDADGTYEFENITFVSSVAHGAGAESRAVSAFSETQKLRFRSCRFQGFTYAVKVDNDPGGDVDLRLEDCEIVGRAAAGPSFGVMFAPPAGRLEVIGGRIRDVGETGTALKHAIYVYEHLDYLVDGVRFSGGVGAGFGIHTFQNPAAGTPKFQMVRGCHFDYSAADGAGDTMKAILVGRVGTLQIRDCVFGCRKQSIVWAGRAMMRGCHFVGTGGNDYRIVCGGTVGAAVGGEISDCTFENAQFYDINLNAPGADLTVRDCRFVGAVSESIDCSAGVKLRVRDCDFTGPTATAIYHPGGAGSELEVRGCVFRCAGKAIELDTAALVRFVLEGNDFSTTAASITSSVAQTVTLARGNHGTNVTFRDRNAGVAAAAQNGTLIPHALGAANISVTPSRYGVTPRVAQRIGVVTAVGTVNLTLGLHNHDGTAIAVTESVAWWAEA